MSKEAKRVNDEKYEHKKRLKVFVLTEYGNNNELPTYLDGTKLIYCYIYSSKTRMRKEINRREEIRRAKK